MIKHLIYILWTRKRKNSLMVVEIAFSFLILFLLFTLLINKYKNASHPIGFNTENILILNLDQDNVDKEDKTKEKQDELYNAIFQTIKQENDVIGVSEIDYSHPYSGSRNTTRLVVGEGVRFDPTEQRFRPSAFDLMDLDFIKGRGFTFEDAQLGYSPIVVNNQFYQKLLPFLDENEMFESEGTSYKITGVVSYYNKQSDFSEQEDIVIRSADYLDWLKDTHQDRLFVKTKNDPRKLEASIVSSIEKLNPKLVVSTDYFDSLQDSYNKWEILPIFLISFVAMFLVLNIALGLYGVLWYNISRRKSEIGVRRAMGASSSEIFQQMLLEVVLLFIIGVVIGGIFAMQFPLLGVFNYTTMEYTMGALIAFGFVFIIILICGYYPSKLATKVTPNEALHEL
ncbi:FtsX-like permease family protein [Flammeovirga sp. MY04]|uniref:ABC transporter permease n=1 Tax=Flammeovirga sp. MY04 TaxID=1191459 RepID=UPI00082580E6|nr:FtsX-like permease family protein [Flammeovirga sp. MY04]ANQ48832.2 FtsX-like permease family protein [Flammeovirga sp. MY04]